MKNTHIPGNCRAIKKTKFMVLRVSGKLYEKNGTMHFVEPGNLPQNIAMETSYGEGRLENHLPG